MSNFLLEIGTEELPAEFARLALPQLEYLICRDLQIHRINYEDLRVTSTPRRLIVQISNLPSSQPDLEEERKGPPAFQAMMKGELGPAMLGFAKRCGVEISNLEIRQTNKGSFVFAHVSQPGQKTIELLKQCIPTWIGGLQGRRFMRWGEQEQKFSRPVRWLVALFDKEIINITLENTSPEVKSGRITRGHRLSTKQLQIGNASSYDAIMNRGQVIVDRIVRAALIAEAINLATLNIQARAGISEELFTELVDLVEQPKLIQGAIAERYLRLPPEVLSTVMRIHQRYIPLYSVDTEIDPLALNSSNALLPQFILISNGNFEATETIRYGNERVLKARLADAEFFLDVDLSTASVERLRKLALITFAEGLGSLKERSDRLVWITQLLTKYILVEASIAKDACKAASLAKHDLASQMVFEFPELQGIMGGKYLLAEGEKREVALAVLEHYMPRCAGDVLPSTEAGSIVALAERLELLLSIFAKGERPSGSSDPYALRRAGNGILQILWHRNWSIDISEILQKTSEHWSHLFPAFQVKPKQLTQELSDLLRQRIISQLSEEGVDIDLIQAVAGETTSTAQLLIDPIDVRSRLKYLISLRKQNRLVPIQAMVQRAAHLADKAVLKPNVIDPKGAFNSKLFESPSEVALANLIESLYPLAKNRLYSQLSDVLSQGVNILETFFDGEESVMVMNDNLEIRNNRLNLLAILHNQANILADFSKLIN
uniref:glycine--tRNA ligase n=1 Tax=Paulinella chromatophora TaxID=39717 RepID=B1X441_PAUCH|nr:putative Glycyl-tRNA synthetase, beta subunit [Paulinella chromatophora]ACB42710.1 putative Glycyl-tRNA synthetase, beta subunit [Paulinella chromatophora]